MFQRSNTIEVEIPDDLVCPLTQQIYLNPVKLPNGTVVEKEMHQRWVMKNHTNPFTRENVRIFEFSEDIETRNKVTAFLNKYPDKKSEQFTAGSVKKKTVRRLCFENMPLVESDEDDNQENELTNQASQLKL